MNRKISLGAALAMMLLVAAATFNITFDFVNNRVNDRMNYLRQREEVLDRFALLNREVRNHFYGTINEVYLLDSISRGFMDGIGDPFAAFHDTRSFEALLRAQAVQVACIGATLRANPEGDGYIYVEEVFADSPAIAAGIQPGDLIIRVDDVDLLPENSVSMLENISGEQGTLVSLTVRSDNVDRDEELIRRIVPIPSVDARIIYGGSPVGYIVISDINQHTPDQLRRERDRLLSLGANSLVIDVRDLEGGELRYLARMMDSLMPTGVIVSSRDKNGDDTVMFTANGPGVDVPIVTLQNAGTTGPAELLVQVLSDYNLARSVGIQSAGRGVIQELIPLGDGTAIEITVALLVSPAGVIYNGVGVQPHYDVAFDGDWRNLDENTDPQLQRGIELARALELAWAAQQDAQTVAAG